MDDMEFKTELLTLLKDMAAYFEKQDSSQERATIDKPPKIGETQKTMSGGEMEGQSAGKGVAKSYPDVPDNAKENETTAIDSSGGEQKKQDFQSGIKVEALGKAEISDVPPEKSSKKEDEKELSKLLKDIRSALQNTITVDQVKSIVSEEVKKAAPAMTEKMLHKMGFHPTKADIVKYGIDDQTQEITKSEDKKEELEDVNIRKAKEVEDLSGKTWRQLAEMRDAVGGFDPFKLMGR